MPLSQYPFLEAAQTEFSNLRTLRRQLRATQRSPSNFPRHKACDFRPRVGPGSD